MFAALKSLASLLLSYGLLIAANSLFGSLLGVRARVEQFPTEIVGLIMASYFLGLLIGAYRVVPVINAVGHIRAFAAFASLMSVTALLHVLVLEPWAWAVMRLLSGFCMAGMITVAESWLHERAANTTRGSVLAVYMITNYLAAGSGQLILPLADPSAFQLFSIASIIFSLALVPVLLTRAEAPQPSRAARLRLTELYRLSPVGFIGVLAAGLSNATVVSLGAVYAQNLGLSLAATGQFMAVLVYSGLLLQWPIGRISDRLDRRWLLIPTALCSSASAVGLALTGGPQSTLLMLLLAVVYGSFSYTIYSLSAAHANDRADPSQRVQVASTVLFVYGLGAVLGPSLAAFWMGRIGPQGLFLQNAAVLGVLASYALYRLLRPGVAAVKEVSPYVPVPASQFTSEQLLRAARDEAGANVPTRPASADQPRQG